MRRRLTTAPRYRYTVDTPTGGVWVWQCRWVLMGVAVVPGNNLAAGGAGVRRRTLTGGLSLWCLLVFGLVVTHQLLMTTERHTWVMGDIHGTIGLAAPSAPGHAVMTAADHDQPAPAMPTMLGDCPAQQAIVPILLVLLTLAVAISIAGATDGACRLATTARGRARVHPPSLAPA